jgi:hypothetical protein
VTSDQPSPLDPQEPVPARERAVVRRAPKIWGFLGLGAMLGVVATIILTLVFRPADGAATVTEDGTQFGLSQVFGFLLVCLIPLGAALGALVAIVLDRILSRRAVEVDVERIGVEGPATSAPTEGTDTLLDPPATASTLPATPSTPPTTPDEDLTRP